MIHGHFAALTSNCYIYFVNAFIKVYPLSLNRQENKLLGNIIYINIGNKK